MKRLTYTFAGAAVAALLAGPTWAGELSMPASKGIYGYGSIGLMTEASADPTSSFNSDSELGYRVMSVYLKTAQDHDLYMDLSLVCKLWNETTASSKGGKKETASADNKLKIHIEVDSYKTNGDYIGSPEVYPHEVVYCEQDTELSATFQGIFQTDTFNEGSGWVVTTDANEDDNIENIVYLTLAECVAAGDGGNTCGEVTTLVGTCLYITSNNRIVLDESCLTSEEVALVLHTVEANAFNWLALDAPAGVQKITIYADIESEAEVMADSVFGDDSTTSAYAKAILGKVGLWVEEGRLVKGVDVDCDNTDADPLNDC